MHKQKSHRGLLKRIRLTGKGKVKFRRAFNGHLRSHKSGNKIRELRRKRTVKAADIGRMKRMLHCQLTPGNREAPSRPAEAPAAAAE